MKLKGQLLLQYWLCCTSLCILTGWYWWFKVRFATKLQHNIENVKTGWFLCSFVGNKNRLDLIFQVEELFWSGYKRQQMERRRTTRLPPALSLFPVYLGFYFIFKFFFLLLYFCFTRITYVKWIFHQQELLTNVWLNLALLWRCWWCFGIFCWTPGQEK